MTPIAAVVVPCANILGESATWSVREQALYWVDIRAPKLHRFKPQSRIHEQWNMPELCGAVVLADKGVVIALRRHLASFDPETSTLRKMLELEPENWNNRLNEAKCDRAGRLWVGSMRDFGAAVSGSLYVVDASLLASRVIENVRIPNSLGWSPDNQQMYFADTGEGVVRRYNFDLHSGRVGASTIHIDSNTPGRPDGAAVDSEGFVWNARYKAGCVVRVDPNGRVVSTIELPASQPTSCALGGSELRTLFVTTARQTLSHEELKCQTGAGHLISAEVDIPGLPDTEFSNRHPAGSSDSCIAVSSCRLDEAGDFNTK